MKTRLVSALTLASTFAFGCGPPSVEDVSGAVSKTVLHATAQAEHSSATVQNMPQLGALAASASGFARSLPDDAFPKMMPLAELPKRLAESMGPRKSVPGHGDTGLGQWGRATAEFLEQRVFTEENVESREGDAIIFRVTGEDLCTEQEPIRRVLAREQHDDAGEPLSKAVSGDFRGQRGIRHRAAASALRSEQEREDTSARAAGVPWSTSTRTPTVSPPTRAAATTKPRV